MNKIEQVNWLQLLVGSLEMLEQSQASGFSVFRSCYSQDNWNFVITVSLYLT